jgi:carboxyl-terminal processing protease
MTSAEYSEMQTRTRGSFGGVGLEVTMENGLVKVVSPIDETPGAKAGILPNDVIVSIDDELAQGLTLSQAVGKMRGAVGSQLKLRVIRPKQDQPIDFIIVRDTIKVKAVRWRIEDNNVGYIRITSFTDQTDEAFRQAIGEINKQIPSGDLKGYVVDLRNNSGGLLNAVISVSDDLLDHGEIVSTRGRTAEQVQRFSAKPGDLSNGKRVVVLINGGTASGSEILAGALQDNKRATLVGTRSFGKGSIETIFPLSDDNGALRLTTSQYFTPSGTSIQAKGITPDIEVLQDEPDDVKKKAPAGEATLSRHLPGQGIEQVASQSYVPTDLKSDKALITAVALLRKDPVKPKR